MKSLMQQKMRLFQVMLMSFLINILAACQTMPQKLMLIPPTEPEKPLIQMIKKDGGHWLSTQDATKLLLYIKEVENYAEKLKLQNEIYNGENNEK